MLKLTDAQGISIREIVDKLKDEGFVNVVPKVRPLFERVKTAQEPLFDQIWPRLRCSIIFDVPAPPQTGSEPGKED